MIKCEICGATPFSDGGTSLHRQNPKGEIGVWRCSDCNFKPVDPAVQEILDVLEDDRIDSSSVKSH